MHFLSCAGEFNHHGKYMCDSLYRILGDDFRRITTQSVDRERVLLGYQNDLSAPYNSTLINASEDEIAKVVSWCDIMDYGAAPEEYLHEAVRQEKIVFIRIERLFKESHLKLLHPKVLLRYYRKYIKYKNNPNVYFLCVSAYAANDLSVLGIKGDRVLQWAYCPEFRSLNPEQLCRVNNPLQIIWCGRMINWKHPETAIKISSYLKQAGVEFKLTMIGDGKQLEEIKKLVQDKELEDVISFTGAVESNKVRDYMEKSDLFFATSDQNEGWGVVINEAMNSGCVVFATPEMGAVPILIQDGINGYYIHRGYEQRTAQTIVDLCGCKSKLTDVKNQAYKTIMENYSPDVYAQRFIQLAEQASSGKTTINIGLGAKAVIRTPIKMR